MITCLIGTRAQLIKMAPILRELETRNIEYRLTFTGQHKVTMPELLADFEIRTKPVYLYEGAEITGVLQMAIWFIRVLPKLVFGHREFMPKERGGSNYVLVHGDTFSTLLGALAARLSGLKVAHIESGLRSFNLFHPFPEEVTRLAIFRLTDIAFCPNAWAISNLSKYRMEKVDCGGNTLLDAVNYAMAHPLHQEARCEHDEYGVVSLHRFENIFNRAQLATILSLVEEAAIRHPLVFVLHPATRKKLIEFQLLERLSGNPRLLIRNRMTYVPFLQLLSRAQFAITDGGSNQEELSYLGIPTLLMRKATERIEGLDQNVTISSYDPQILRAFLAHLEPTNPLPIQGMNISGRIVDKLAGYGERKTK